MYLAEVDEVPPRGSNDVATCGDARGYSLRVTMHGAVQPGLFHGSRIGLSRVDVRVPIFSGTGP